VSQVQELYSSIVSGDIMRPYSTVKIATGCRKYNHASFLGRSKVYTFEFLKFQFIKLKLNSVASVNGRTIPTEQLPPVGEVSGNFCI
jgi:hypothetical protein